MEEGKMISGKNVVVPIGRLKQRALEVIEREGAIGAEGLRSSGGWRRRKRLVEALEELAREGVIGKVKNGRDVVYGRKVVGYVYSGRVKPVVLEEVHLVPEQKQRKKIVYVERRRKRVVYERRDGVLEDFNLERATARELERYAGGVWILGGGGEWKGGKWFYCSCCKPTWKEYLEDLEMFPEVMKGR